MPIFEFKCPRHGLFDIFSRMGGAPDEATCVHWGCNKRGKRVFSAPALVNVQRDWNEEANDYQRDAYTQAKAQLTNVAREEAEHSGGSPRPVKEESVQAAAKAIADKKPKKSVVQRAVERHKQRARERKRSAT